MSAHVPPKTPPAASPDDAPIATLAQRAREAIDAATTLDALEAARVAALGRRAPLALRMRGLGGLAPDQRKAAGEALNQAKRTLAEAIDARAAMLRDQALADAAKDAVDITLPTIAPAWARGRLHPLTQTLETMVAIFAAMGFSVEQGPDIETEAKNFARLNMPADHPARGEHDTFYFPKAEDGSDDGTDARRLLRTHTSPVQIRALAKQRPPLRMIAPGRVYRRDSDRTHTPMFHQLEGLVIEPGVHLGHLKGTLDAFFAAFFNDDTTEARLRPGHFPFTEPSVEVDIRRAGGDWLEILGAGMVHPRVLEAAGLDSGEHQGFAFGFGVDRLAMLKYGLDDLRAFFAADLDWIGRNGFAALAAPSVHGGLDAL